jgi:hypothetical protein
MPDTVPPGGEVSLIAIGWIKFSARCANAGGVGHRLRPDLRGRERRRCKRGLMEDPAKRVFTNELV